MRHSYKTTTVGLVIALALAMAAISILSVGREEGFFVDRVPFVTDFPNVDGLSVGGPVRLIGVQVGVVSAINLPDDITKQEVDVVFAVDRRHWDRIRQGTTATLRNLTYLSGEKYIELKPGDPGLERIPEGGYIESPRSEVQKIIEQSQSIAGNIEEISSMLRELLGALNEGQSVLSRLITDPAFGQDMMASASASLERLNSIVTRLDQGDGLVGRLLSDEAFADETLNRLNGVLDRLESIAARAEAGDSVLGQLLAEESDLLDTARDLGEVVASARQILGTLESGRGAAGRLLLDDEYGKTVTARLDAILADTASIIGKIDSGDGTLGRLVNEPELYDEATEVVGGLSDSRFLKWVARRVRNKEIKRKINEYADQLEKAEKAGEQAR